MSPSQVRSRGGCLACKSKHKKCDETKPDCQRCERSGLQCSGYAFVTCDSEGKAVKHLTRPRSKLRTRARQQATPVQTRQRVTEAASTSTAKGAAATVRENAPESSFSFIEHSSEGGYKDLGFDTTNHAFDAARVASHPSFGFTRPETAIEGNRQNKTRHNAPNDQSSYTYPADYLPIPQSGVLYTPVIQTSSHSTTQHSNLVLGQRFTFPRALNSSHPANPGIGPQDPEAMNLESNSLSFILENYVAWIQRTAFDPVKVARKSKDRIVKHFGDSIESRWTIILLSNLIGKLAKSRSMEEINTPTYLPIVSELRKRVCLRITRSKSHSQHGELEIRETVMMLENVVDTTMVFAIAGSADPRLELMREAAPLFHWACPDSPSRQIHLQTLFLQPTGYIRDYVAMDIFWSVLSSRPMIIQYDTTIDPELGLSVMNLSDDTGIQWTRGIPDQVTLVFARINALRGTSIWDLGFFTELETTLRDFVPIATVASEPNLVIGKTAVQECWRQTAYIYLYMGLCGVSADDPRVIQARSNFFTIVNSVKPGRVPDTFIMLCFAIAGVAAHDEVDRGIIRYRMLGVETLSYRRDCALAMLEKLWKMVDTESRPAMWADLKSIY
ncbi:unnamed protein product [Rhizoctonia solani]|uniref:Zn(2)-C6 fungal-type domain-containing protein n=1 Tax=Rhizoctonia solani TaxID=456999 RepID=A0A8H2WZA1_9AGAM|nr:unnamed protein product [Rhizoctonia solani]